MFGLGKKHDEPEETAYPRAIVDQEESTDFLQWLAEDRERALQSFEDALEGEPDAGPLRSFLRRVFGES